MRIALRTSGGRGEYEVAGTHESIKVHDVYDRQIRLEILPGFKFDTDNYIRHTQGKPRIRLGSTPTASHIYLLLSAILLLPKPKREIGATPAGKVQIYKDNFSVYSIPFDVVELDAVNLCISPTHMILSNSSLTSVRLDVIERMQTVIACWEAAEKQKVKSSLAQVVLKHRDAFNNGDLGALVHQCNFIRTASLEVGDPLRYLTKQFDLPNLDEIMWLGIHATEIEEANGLGEENLEDLKEAARNRIKVWRQVVSRGVAGTRFSLQVRQAYDHTCLFTGMKLPKTAMTGSSGVDAAHILPWAEYGLNSVSNGLCLSKLCHWAFDSGILQLKFYSAKDIYTVELSAAAIAAESEHLIDLGSLKQTQGVVSRSLLPKDRDSWPNPSFLKVYNEASNR